MECLFPAAEACDQTCKRLFTIVLYSRRVGAIFAGIHKLRPNRVLKNDLATVRIIARNREY